MNKKYLYLISGILIASLETHAMFLKKNPFGSRVMSHWSYKRLYTSKSSKDYFRVCLKSSQGHVFEIPQKVLDRYEDLKISEIAKLYKVKELKKELRALSLQNDSESVDNNAPIMSHHQTWSNEGEIDGPPCPLCRQMYPTIKNPYLYRSLFEAIIHLKNDHQAEINGSYYYPSDPQVKHFIQQNWGILYRIALKNDSED